MILCLTGWQQKRDALAAIVPEAQYFDYMAYDNSATMFAALPENVELAVGWSLGGQLLAHAVAGGFVKPKKLALLAAPFQCVADGNFVHAMPAVGFKDIRDKYANDPRTTMAQFQAIAGFGNKPVIRDLTRDLTLWKNGLFWLEELGRSTCRELDFRAFPETVIVHGTNDKVIDVTQAKEFAARIPRSQLVLLPEASHALHLHAPELIKELLKPCLTNAA